MTSWPPVTSARSRSAPDTALTLMVERVGRDDPVLHWCEVQSAGLIVRTTFEERPPLSEALLPPLVPQVAALLHRCGTAPGLFRLPEARIEAGGIALTQFCVQNAPVVDGRQEGLVKFRLLSGGADRVLAGASLPAVHVRESERLALAVLVDVALPLVNLCQSAAHLPRPADSLTAQWVERLSLNAHEIGFRMELLKRIVAQDMAGDPVPGRVAPPTAIIGATEVAAARRSALAAARAADGRPPDPDFRTVPPPTAPVAAMAGLGRAMPRGGPGGT